jgi:hypothetical protein
MCFVMTSSCYADFPDEGKPEANVAAVRGGKGRLAGSVVGAGRLFL